VKELLEGSVFSSYLLIPFNIPTFDEGEIAGLSSVNVYQSCSREQCFNKKLEK